jgi:hypothetical protein
VPIPKAWTQVSWSAQFAGAARSDAVYLTVQEILRERRCDLSAYRLCIGDIWVLTVLGQEPDPFTAQAIIDQLQRGQLVELGAEIEAYLWHRRRVVTACSSWAEAHHSLPEKG